MLKIVKHKEVQAPISVERLGGKHDGQEFRTVMVEMNDGSVRGLWVSNTSQRYFKRVFVPWDFEHPAIEDDPYNA